MALCKKLICKKKFQGKVCGGRLKLSWTTYQYYSYYGLGGGTSTIFTYKCGKCKCQSKPKGLPSTRQSIAKWINDRMDEYGKVKK